jgi:UDP-N-acetylglucosamine 4-epimerase
MMRSLLLPDFPHLDKHRPQYTDFREGDIRHSQADISKAVRLLGFEPSHRIGDGLKEAMDWYKKNLVAQS